jgi:hypothetical protein
MSGVPREGRVRVRVVEAVASRAGKLGRRALRGPVPQDPVDTAY